MKDTLFYFSRSSLCYRYQFSEFLSISFHYHCRLPNGERESEVIPRDIHEKLDKIKENFHDLEGAVRQQRLYLTSLSLPEQKVFLLPVDHQRVEEAMNHFITWLSRAEEVAFNYQPLKADLITLREEEIANTVC